MAESTARHARETLARVGKMQGEVSRESIRKAKILNLLTEQTDEPELAHLAQSLMAGIVAGRISLDRAYRTMMDDGSRVPMYIRLPSVIDEAVRERAAMLGCSRQFVVEATLAMALLPQIFGEALSISDGGDG